MARALLHRAAVCLSLGFGGYARCLLHLRRICYTGRAMKARPAKTQVKAPKKAATVKAQKGYIEILDDRCKGCDLCVPVCPVDIIEKASSDKVNWMGWIPVQVSDMSKCIACKLCAVVCPDQAINVFRFDKPIPRQEENGEGSP